MQLNITDVRVVPGDSGFLIDTGKTTLPSFLVGYRMPTGSTPGS